MTSKIITNRFYDKRETRNFILFALGKFVSIFGNSIYTFAIGLFVLRSTGSGLSFATTLVLGTIPVLIFNPIAGVLADRLDKKKLVVGMDILSGVVLLIVYFLSLTYGLSLLMIYISTFIITSFTCVFGVSIETAKPNMVSDGMLLNINSVSKIIDSVSSILGPMIGGMVFAFMDIKFFILINGVSYVMSGISEMFIDFRFNLPESKISNQNNLQQEELKSTSKVFIDDIKDGFRYILKRSDIINITGVFVALNFFLGLSISVPLPYIISNVLKLSSSDLGIIQGSLPVGLIIGALLIKKIIEKISYNKLLVNTSKCIALCMILIGLPVIFLSTTFNSKIYLVYYCTTMVLLGVFLAFVDIPIMYIMQKYITEEYRGRVMSLVITVAKVTLPIALIISGVLLNLIPPYVLPITGGIMLLLVSIFILRRAGEEIQDLQ